jgi:hypothetical protein
VSLTPSLRRALPLGSCLTETRQSALCRSDVVVAVVNDEEYHFPRRDLAQNRVRKQHAVEVAIAPTPERCHEPRVHPLPSSQELRLTVGDLFRRKSFSWRDEPAASSATAREATAIIVP